VWCRPRSKGNTLTLCQTSRYTFARRDFNLIGSQWWSSSYKRLCRWKGESPPNSAIWWQNSFTTLSPFVLELGWCSTASWLRAGWIWFPANARASLLLRTFTSALGTIQPPIQWGSRAPTTRKYRSRGAKMNFHLNLLLRLIKNELIYTYHGRPLKKLLDTWDRNGSTSGPHHDRHMMMIIIMIMKLYFMESTGTNLPPFLF
jgi:hypothetical protein